VLIVPLILQNLLVICELHFETMHCQYRIMESEGLVQSDRCVHEAY
jgi:hypothetical protein